jgi:hypothetical protein
MEEAMRMDELAAYIRVLAVATDSTRHAEDRPRYQAHLAAAARMFVAIHAGDNDELKRLIEQERHGYGWSYLSGDEGEQAHAAWAAFDATLGL